LTPLTSNRPAELPEPNSIDQYTCRMPSNERQPQVVRAQLVSKAFLSPDEMELYELTQLAGCTLDQEVFKILSDLLKMNVSSEALLLMLRSMCSPHTESSSHPRHVGSTRTAASGEPYAHLTSRSDAPAQRRYDTASDAREPKATLSEDRQHVSMSSRDNARMRVAAASRPSNRSNDRSDKRGNTSAYSDVYVTRRPRSNASDLAYNEDRDRANKKRHSHR